MLIFGYGPRAPRDRGAAVPLQCPQCHDLTWFHLVTVRNSVSLFFVPVIPVKTEDALVCAACRHAFPLGRPDAASAVDMVRETQRFGRGEISELQYGFVVDQFWQRVARRSGPGGTPEGAHWQPTTPTEPTAAADPVVVGGAASIGALTTHRHPPPAPPDPFAAPARPPPSTTPTPVDDAATSAPPPDPTTRVADPSPGWYPDPEGTHAERYWDGGRWTRATR